MSSKTLVAKLGAICLDSKHSPKLTQESRKLFIKPFTKYTPGPCLQPGGKMNSGLLFLAKKCQEFVMFTECFNYTRSYILYSFDF